MEETGEWGWRERREEERAPSWCERVSTQHWPPTDPFTEARSTSRNTGTRNTGTFRNTPKKLGTPLKILKKAQNMLPLKENQIYHGRMRFSKLHPLIAYKIIWLHLHNLENIYKRHTVTNVLSATRSLSSLAGTNTKYNSRNSFFWIGRIWIYFPFALSGNH